MRATLLSLILCCVVPAQLSAQDTANMLTHGMVQLSLHVGTTSQAEVIEALGAPNITTIDGSGREVWVYDRHATVSASSSSSFSIGILVGGVGAGVGAGGGLGFGKGKNKHEESSRSMTLIIKFDEAKKVIDFKSRSSSF